MKIIYCIVNVTHLESFSETIRTSGITDFQIIEQLYTEFSKGDPRMNTHVWPGFSSAIIAQTEDKDKIQLILDEAKTHNKNRNNDDEIIRVYVWKTEDYITD